MSRSEAFVEGWTAKAIEHAVRSGRWRRAADGIYAPRIDGLRAIGSDSWAEESRRCLQDAAGATRVSPGAVISHQAAAVAWELPVLGTLRACVTVSSTDPRRRLEVAHVHRAGLPPEEQGLVGGYAVTAPARTVLDVSREHGFEAGLIAADAALCRGLIGPDQLTAALSVCANWPRHRSANRVVLDAHSESESPLESISRARLKAAGLPRPSLQTVIRDRRGRFVARTDFYWDGPGVVGEADGETKYQTRQDVIDERRRQRRLEDLGLRVERWGWTDLRDFEPVVSRLRKALTRTPPNAGERLWLATPPPRVP